MGRVFYSIIFIFFLFYQSIKAEDIIRISPDKKEYDLTSSTLLCLDHLKTYSIDMFIQKNDLQMCKIVNADGLPNGYTDATIWIRSKIQTSKGMNGQWIAELDSALLDYVDLYVIKNGKVLQHFESGDMRPLSSRPMIGRTFRFPIHFTPGTTELVWKIYSTSGIHLPLKLYEKEKLKQVDLKEYFFYGTFYGILLILAIYNFVFYIGFRKIVYFYYVAFIVSYGMMDLSFDGFTPLLIPDLPWLYHDGVLFFVALSVLFSVLFGQRFLETSINVPKIHRLLNVLIILDMIPLLLSFFDLYYITTKFAAFFGVITPIALIYTGVRVFKNNPRRATFYLIAWSIFFVGTTLFSLHKFGLFQGSWFIMRAQELGVLFKAMVLSFALSDQLQSLLYVDQLTGVGNRDSINRIFTSIINYSRKKRLSFAVLTINIDDFKSINDSLSHKMGDKLLKLLAKRLQSSLSRNNTILRMGQDEFIIIMEKVKNTDVLTLYAENILTQVRKPFTLDEHIIHITASVGIALYPNDGLDYDTLLKNSGNALHKAKQLGKNRLHFFNSDLDDTATEHLSLYNDLFRALENQELFLLYQPKINAKDRTLAGVEVLIRWEHPEHGLISPNTFIQIAEENDIILRVTRWMLEESFKQLKRWHAMGWKDIYLAANITSKDLQDKYFIKDLVDLLNQYNLSPDLLELELTERILMEENEASIQRMQALNNVGIKIAIDDFGTGYSSFKYLQSYQANTIKIDKSFIDEIESDPKAAKIVKAMTTLGHELGMKVVVEGVENEKQVKILTKMQCDIFQGYYFDKPLIAKVLESKYFLEK